ncbi:hypothetical protein E2P86_03135 [Sphingobacterium psychroaquaticum]|uniref:outer membrane protein assembly factor BamB family protein n=1 Tax=Sphingobacterium psychroaquaticum TaxID=561061 RepID=UPI00106A8D89|nr:PQQ-binding-like beta-propeller repeat protein [Sphingobacterium psychroaquaticum]QBQ40195.1 hypothetical protein E2P86_03135 [Sphingobacterium psychroaquaticum]
MRHFFLLAFTIATLPALAKRSGKVFHDTNQNNMQETAELGLFNTVVSDGYHVVLTKKDGTFTLPENPDARFISVTIPTGYKAVKRHYIPVNSKEDYQFALTKDDSQNLDVLRFIQVTDTETSLYGPWIDNVRNYAKAQNVSVLMHTGDICYEPGMRFHANQITSDLMGLSTYYAVGNHDLVKGEYGEKLFEDLFGPTYYSFDAGPAHFVVTPMPGGDYKPSYTVDQVIRWLQKDLALKDPKKPLIFINHDFFSATDFVLKGEKESIDLKQYNLKAWLYGHWHNNYIFQQSGVYVVCSGAPNKGGIDNSAGQFLVVDIDHQGVKNIKPVYTNIRSHIELMPVLPTTNGILPLDIVVYDSERTIQGVAADLYDKAGNHVAAVPLSSDGGWHWQAEFNDAKRKATALTVSVTYNNGTQDIRQMDLVTSRGKSNDMLQPVWRKTIGGNIWKTSPLIVNDKLFIGTMDDGFGVQNKLLALEAATGNTIWKYPTTNSIKHVLQHHNGILLATDVTGKVYALDTNTGATNWMNSRPKTGIPTFVSGPTIDKEIYYTGLGRNLKALHIPSGNVLWQAKEPGGGEATAAALRLSDGVIYAGINWNALFAYKQETGELLWKRDQDGLRFRSGGVTVNQDTLYTAGLNGLFKLNPKTGETYAKSIKTDDFKVMADPLVMGDLLIMPTSSGGVKAFSRSNLEEKWHFTTGEALVYTAPYSTPDQRKTVATVESGIVEHKGKLFFGASDGYFYVLDKTGKLIQKINMGAPIFAEPTIVGDKVYVADFSGTVSCFKLR